MRNSVKSTGGVTYDQIFKAIGDPHRLLILSLLREKEMSAGEILQALDIVQSTLSHHMKSLTDAGVVTAVRHGKWTYYSLNTECLSGAAAFLEEYAQGTRQYADKGGGEDKPVKTRQNAPAPDAEETDAPDAPAAAEKKKSKKGKKGKKNKK